MTNFNILFITCPYAVQNIYIALNISLICTYNVLVSKREVRKLAPKEKANTERVSTFLSEKHLLELREEAERKGTNVSALIRMIILEHLANKK